MHAEQNLYYLINKFCWAKPAQYILLEPALYIKKYERTLIYYKRLCIRNFSVSSFYNFFFVDNFIYFVGSSAADSFRAKIPENWITLRNLQIPTNLKIGNDSQNFYKIYQFFIHIWILHYKRSRTEMSKVSETLTEEL